MAKTRLDRRGSRRQTPDFGSFDFDDRGEMLVPLLEDAASTPATVRHPDGVAPTGTGAASALAPDAPSGRVRTTRARLGMVLLAMVSMIGAGMALVRRAEPPDGNAGGVPTAAQPRVASEDAGVREAALGDDRGKQPLVCPAQEPGPRIRDRGEAIEVWASPPAHPTSPCGVPAVDHAIPSGPGAKPPSPSTRRPEPPGMIRVLSGTPDARAFIDGKDRGPVPVDIGGVKAGDHVVRISAPGFQSSERHVNVTAGDAKVMKLDLVRERSSDTGTLRVTSTIAGAVVFVDGAQVGKVPQDQLLAQGEHAVAVRLDGYRPFEQKVRIETGQVTTVQADLAAIGRLRVLSTPAKARVTINGTPAGVTPLEVDVPLGELKLRIDLAGFMPVEQTLTVRGGKTETLWRELTRAIR